jgi:hypothetical protein
MLYFLSLIRAATHYTFLVLVEPTINIESLAVYLQLHWIDLLMIKLDILYIKKKRKEKKRKEKKRRALV